jgi:hypothetical protein
LRHGKNVLAAYFVLRGCRVIKFNLAADPGGEFVFSCACDDSLGVAGTAPGGDPIRKFKFGIHAKRVSKEWV